MWEKMFFSCDSTILIASVVPVNLEFSSAIKTTTPILFPRLSFVLIICERETGQHNEENIGLGWEEGWKKWKQSKPSIMNELKAFHIVHLCLSFMFTRRIEVECFCLPFLCSSLLLWVNSFTFYTFFSWMQLLMLWESSAGCTHTSKSWMLWNVETIMNSFRKKSFHLLIST